MKTNSAIIIGGTGQFGVLLGKLLIKKRFKVYNTSRSTKKIVKYKKKYSKINFVKLNIYNKNEIKKLLIRLRPNLVFYFASQSSPRISFLKKKETIQSNYEGCKNILKVINDNKIDTKFINATSSEMYGHIKGKINLYTNKKPLNPYGKAKKKSFELVKNFRNKNNMKNYNAILFNTESFLRQKDFLISKICLAAIHAYKDKKKTELNNILVSREWNWCEEQCEVLLKIIKKEPQDFILSNGKCYSIKEMLQFAFGFFNLKYQDYILIKNYKLKKNEVKIKRSNFRSCLIRNKINMKPKIYGKKLIYKMIKFYLNEEKS